jgi:hypothetical protein
MAYLQKLHGKAFDADHKWRRQVMKEIESLKSRVAKPEKKTRGT